MKKYIRHNGDKVLYEHNTISYYIRTIDSLTRNVNCFNKFTRGNSLKDIEIGKYKIVETTKFFSVTKNGFIEIESNSILMSNKEGETFSVNEEHLNYENGFYIGRILLTEKKREYIEYKNIMERIYIDYKNTMY
jgi:hypothetical protein